MEGAQQKRREQLKKNNKEGDAKGSKLGEPLNPEQPVQPGQGDLQVEPKQDLPIEPKQDLQVEPKQDLHDFQVVPSAKASSSRAKRGHEAGDIESEPVKRVKLYRSPQEILDHLQPPGCKLTLGFLDHRFSCRYEVESSALTGKFKQKTFSKSFAEKVTWQEALRQVHKYMWEKWNVVKAKFPLGANQAPQKPGEVEKSIFDQLKETIDNLPPVTKY